MVVHYNSLHCIVRGNPTTFGVHTSSMPVAITLLVYTCTAECVSAKGNHLINELL